MTRTRIHILLAVLLTVALALTLAACGDDDASAAGSTPSTAPAADCSLAALPLVSSGTLTVGTDKPAFPPYFNDNDPTNGKGFESAAAYAIANELGFAKDDVKWIVVPFNASYAPGPKNFDFDVNQISITPARAKAGRLLDAVLHGAAGGRSRSMTRRTREGHVARRPEGRRDRRAGRHDQPRRGQRRDPADQQPQVFNNSNDVVTALKHGQVDAIVVDLPTALYLTAAQVRTARVVGQFSAPGGDRLGRAAGEGLGAHALRLPAIDRAPGLGRAAADHRTAGSAPRRRCSALN